MGGFFMLYFYTYIDYQLIKIKKGLNCYVRLPFNANLATFPPTKPNFNI